MPIEVMDYSLFLFDLDSTLTESISGNKFPQTVTDRKWMPGRLEHIAQLVQAGKHTAIVTNQGGAAWGIFTPEEMDAYLNNLVWKAGMDAFYACYHDTSEKARGSDRTIKELTVPDLYKGHERRKPGQGMLLQAMDDFGIHLYDTLYVGDREEDKIAAAAAGVDFEWAWSYFGDSPVIA
jgi:D-glycero-D-manno-heptose 1,7-bisphosphate phosphatase